ncbi:hypothetical protein GY50_1454 [Dehalococcoides mccartyi GY50]|nr:hypothetical protein GY50_1454 [Dehalococcoides mccartyi GY50]
MTIILPVLGQNPDCFLIIKRAALSRPLKEIRDEGTNTI